MTELLEQAVAGIIKPMVEVHEYSETFDILQKLAHDCITGRVVIRLPR